MLLRTARGVDDPHEERIDMSEGIRFPAACNRCAHMWLSTGTDIPGGSLIAAGPGVRIEGLTISDIGGELRCPACGYTAGHVLDGSYNYIDRTLEALRSEHMSEADYLRLRTFLMGVEAGLTWEQVEQRAEREVPDLAPTVKRLKPPGSKWTKPWSKVAIAVVTAIGTTTVNAVTEHVIDYVFEEPAAPAAGPGGTVPTQLPQVDQHPSQAGNEDGQGAQG